MSGRTRLDPLKADGYFAMMKRADMMGWTLPRRSLELYHSREIEEAARKALREMYQEMEAQALMAVCDLLCDRGRILPGEPIIEVSREDRLGGGNDRYCFPDHWPR